MRLAGLFVVALVSPVVAQGVHSPGATYFQVADSPFALPPFDGVPLVLETFEDGSLDTVVGVSGGLVLVRSDDFGDSVDFDDGVIDNNGNSNGQATGAYYSAGEATLVFTLPADSEGRLPTHAGVVITDALDSTPIVFSARRGGVDLGSVQGFQTAENFNVCLQDRFYGFVDRMGIEQIIVTGTVSNDWAMDHLQFGTLLCTGDIAPPFGLLDLSDVDAFISAFLNGDADADLAAPLGIIDLSDIDAFIASFLSGCA